MRSHWVELVTGAYDQAIAYAEAAHRLGVESHNLDAQALSHFMLGSIYWEQGKLDQAETTMVDDIAVAEQAASLTPLVGTRAELGLLRGELGDPAQGLELANLARTVAETKLPILRFWPHAVQVSLELRPREHRRGRSVGRRSGRLSGSQRALWLHALHVDSGRPGPW